MQTYGCLYTQIHIYRHVGLVHMKTCGCGTHEDMWVWYTCIHVVLVHTYECGYVFYIFIYVSEAHMQTCWCGIHVDIWVWYTCIHVGVVHI